MHGTQSPAPKSKDAASIKDRSSVALTAAFQHRRQIVQYVAEVRSPTASACPAITTPSSKR